MILAVVFASTRVADALEGIASGGFLDSSTSAVTRPRLSAAEIAAFLPSRGEFRFPAPYSTQGVRLTNGSDCQGQDCVLPVGYSYWSNINNHTGRDEMLIFLGLHRSKGGPGPSLFSYNKTTGETKNRGALFDASSPYSWSTGEGWYFSATRPTTLYITAGSQLTRYDVESHASELVVDVRAQFGADKYLWQAHSSSDDRVHSATLRQDGTWAMLGCVVYDEGNRQALYFAKRGEFDECQIDKSGRWLVIKENVDGRNGEDNRVIDLHNGQEQVLLDEQGAAGHSDLGFGYMVAEDNFNNLPSAVRRWDLSKGLSGGETGQGELVYHAASWGAGLGHVAFGGAQGNTSIDRQMACASNASRQDLPRVNEIVCFPLDGSLDVRVVAPNLTDLNAAGGGPDDYSKLPKGNVDVTGEFFVWTANAGTNRLDAFIVRLSAPKTDAPPAGPEAFDKSAPASGASDVGASVDLSWAASTGAASYDYCVDTTDNNQCDGDWSSNGANLSAAASGLNAGTTYYWQVRASNSSGSVLANMNVWWSFTTARVSNPAMAIEAPGTAHPLAPSFTVAGWAIDQGSTTGAGVDRVDVYAAKSGQSAQHIGTALYGAARPDVAAVYGSHFLNSGFSLTVSGLAPGTYALSVVSHSMIGGSNTTRTIEVTVAGEGRKPKPAMALDSPSSNATVGQSFSVSGWAVDLAALQGAGADAIHAWAFPKGGAPVFLGVASYGASRGDVGAVLGAQFSHSGFSLSATLPPGSYQVIAYMHSTVAGTFNAALARDITVVEKPTIPSTYMDEPVNNSIRPRSQPFTVSGWAIDQGAATGTGVTDIHVWAFPATGVGFPQFVGVAAYGTPRPDVAAAYGDSKLTNSGYTLAVPGNTLPAGTYWIVAYGNSSVTGGFTQAVLSTATFTP